MNDFIHGFIFGMASVFGFFLILVIAIYFLSTKEIQDEVLDKELKEKMSKYIKKDEKRK